MDDVANVGDRFRMCIIVGDCERGGRELEGVVAFHLAIAQVAVALASIAVLRAVVAMVFAASLSSSPLPYINISIVSSSLEPAHSVPIPLELLEITPES